MHTSNNNQYKLRTAYSKIMLTKPCIVCYFDIFSNNKKKFTLKSILCLMYIGNVCTH